MVKIPVVRHVQKGQIVYLGHMTATLARYVAFADFYPPIEGRIGYQRPPDLKRAHAFAKHLKDDVAGFMTPILLNARRPMKFVPLKEHEDMGHLVIDEGAVAAIVDGQHRSLGVNEFSSDGNFPVPFMLFNQLDTETEQQLFITINQEQKRVSMSHVHFIARKSDTLAELVTRLESDPGSPWFRRVNLVGAKGTKRPVSLQSLRTALEELLQAGEVKLLPDDQQYDIAVGFWRGVAAVWPLAWDAPKKSLLTKSIGTLAVAKLGGYLLPRCLYQKGQIMFLDADKLSTYLFRAQSVNWMSDGTFRGFAGRHGADLVKHHLDALIFGKGSISP